MVRFGWWKVGMAIACVLSSACGDDAVEDSTSSATSGAGAGSSTGGQASASTGSSVTSSGSGGGLSFAGDIWPVLVMPRDPPLAAPNDSCSGANGCHLAGAGGLVLPDATTGYDNLIDMPSSSTLCAGTLLVVATQPDESCFVLFYEQRLRDQLGWVDQSETDLVRAWVQQGAAP